jgi:protein Mpv17
MRTSRFGFLGFALIAPVIHNFYAVVNARFPGRSLKAVLQRTLVDQLLFAPLFIPTFMTSLMILEGKGTGQHEDFTVITDTLKQKVPDVVVTNWMVWMPAIFLNFRYVPVQWQVLYSNCVGFGWNTYLSWKTQENDKN